MSFRLEAKIINEKDVFNGIYLYAQRCLCQVIIQGEQLILTKLHVKL